MLPIPAFVALILAWLALRTARQGGQHFLVALLALTAGQSLMVALVGGYGVDALRPLLPVTATAIPPLAWVTFRAGLFGRDPSLAIHAAAPAFALFCAVFAPMTLDAVVSLSFLSYGAALLIQLHRAQDMPHAQLGAGEVPARIWRVLGWLLIASALVDGAIATAFMTGHAAWAGWIITVFSSLILLGLGLLTANPSASGPGQAAEDGGGEGGAPAHGAGTPPAHIAPSETDRAEDSAILARLDTLLEREQACRDPDLTLFRLGRRLHLPEKRLSLAVNRTTGGNVSRYVNAARIRHACALLDGGASITQAMLDSGFNTKSNFNREFQRILNCAPSQYRARERQLPVPGRG